MTTRRLLIYGGVILLALTTVFAIVANNGNFRAAVNDTAITDGGTGGTGGTTGGTTNTVSCIIQDNGTAFHWGAAVAKAAGTIGLANTDCTGTCSEGNPPSDVPGSVTASGTAADTTAQGTQTEIEAVKATTKTDIESGSIKGALDAAGKVVYETQAAAKTAMQKVWDTNIVPNLRVEYYQAGWGKISSRTTTSGNQAKGFFGSQYSRDLNKWGPQATGQYSFFRSGSANLTGRATIGGFTYNGQSLGSGFADFSLTGTWNIIGDTLQAVAAYDCEVGDASGSTSVTGSWKTIGVKANIPVWVKSGTSAVRVTFQFGVNFVDNTLKLPFNLVWKF